MPALKIAENINKFSPPRKACYSVRAYICSMPFPCRQLTALLHVLGGWPNMGEGQIFQSTGRRLFYGQENSNNRVELTFNFFFLIFFTIEKSRRKEEEQHLVVSPSTLWGNGCKHFKRAIFNIGLTTLLFFDQLSFKIM